MRDSNNLNTFRNGGSHESNPLGGIPMGNNDSVEQGETMSGKYIYSDRIPITKEAAAQFNLPKSAVGKTYAQFTSALQGHFKDRNGMPDKNTLKAGLDRAKQAQEQERARMQQQIQQAQDINATEVPDQMNGQIPQGMEQFALGGPINDPLGQYSSKITDAPMDAAGKAGSMFGNFGAGDYAQMGGAALGAIGTALKPQPLNPINPLTVNAVRANAKFADNQYAYGGYREPHFGGGFFKSVGQGLANYGKALADTSLTALGMDDIIKDSDYTGTGANLARKTSSIVGGVSKAVLPMAANVLLPGSGAAITMAQQGLGAIAPQDPAKQAQAMMPPDGTYAYGGELNQYASGGGLSRSEDRGSDKKPYPSVASKDFAGGGRSYPIPTKADAVDALRLAGLHGRSDVRAKVYAKYPELKKHADGGPLTSDEFYGVGKTPFTLNPTSQNVPASLDPNTARAPIESVNFTTQQPMSGVQTNTSFPSSPSANAAALNAKGPNVGLNWTQLGRAATTAGMFAPAVGNIMQKISKPEIQGQAINTRRFHYTPVDTQQLQTIAGNEMTNTINAMQQSGASPAEMRSAILGSGLNRTKGLSDAYMQAAAQNRAMDIQGQQFDMGIDEANIQRGLTVDDINARNRAAYNREKSEKLQAIAGNIGDASKYIRDAESVKAMTGYTQYGDYTLNPQTGTWFTKDGKGVSAKEALAAMSANDRAKYLASAKGKGFAFGGQMLNGSPFLSNNIIRK